MIVATVVPENRPGVIGSVEFPHLNDDTELETVEFHQPRHYVDVRLDSGADLSPALAHRYTRTVVLHRIGAGMMVTFPSP